MSNWWEQDAVVDPQQAMASLGVAEPDGQKTEDRWWEQDPAIRADIGHKAILADIEEEKKQKADQEKRHAAQQSLETYGEIPHVANQIVTDTATVAERLIGIALGGSADKAWNDRADEVNREQDIIQQEMVARDRAYWRADEDPAEIEAKLQENLRKEKEILDSKEFDETQKAELVGKLQAERQMLENDRMSIMDRAGQYIPFLKQGVRGAVRSLGTAILGAKGAGAALNTGRIATGAAAGAVRGAAARGAAGAAAGAAQGAGAAARGALATSGSSAAGAIGLASAQQANKAMTEGADAGLTGSALTGYVASQAAIEAFPAIVMQKLGLGGVEAMLAGPAIRGGVKAGFIAAIKATGQEIPEELETEILSAVSSEYAGVDKEALDPDRLSSLVADTILQTVLMSAGASAVQTASGSAQERLARLQEIRAKGFVSAEDAKKEGIEGKTRKERLANADKQIQELTQAASQEASPPSSPGQQPASPQGNPPSPQGPGSTGAAPPSIPPSAPPSPQPTTPPVATQSGAEQPATPPEAESKPSSFDEYINEWKKEADKRSNKPSSPISEGTKQSLVESIENLADRAIQKGSVTKWASDNSKLDELELGEVQNAVRRKGYEPSPFIRSRKNGVDYIGFDIVGKRQDAPAKQEPPVQQPPKDAESPAEPAPQSPSATQPSQSEWDVVPGPGGKLYRMDPNAKTPGERVRTRIEVDPSEGVVLVTKDQFGKPIPPEVLKARQEFADKAKPGVRFDIKGYEPAHFKVADDGSILDLTTGRQMNSVRGMVNYIKPGAIVWAEPTKPPAGPSEEGKKPTTGSPTVSSDAPAKPETSMGKPAVDQASEASADQPRRDQVGGMMPAESAKPESPSELRPLKKGEVRPRVEGQTWDEVGTGETSESIKEKVPGLEVDPLSIRGTHELVEKIVFDVKEINSRRLAARKRRQRKEREKAPLFSEEIASQQADPLEELQAIDAKNNQNREFYDAETRRHWMENLQSLAELPLDEQRRFVTFWNNKSIPSSWTYFAETLRGWKSGKINTSSVVDRSSIADQDLRARIEKLDKVWVTLKDIERKAGDPKIARERLEEEKAKYAELGFSPPDYESKEKTFAEVQAEKAAARKAREAEARKEILPGILEDQGGEEAANAKELESLKPQVSNAMDRFFEEADNFEDRNNEAMEKAQDELEELDRRIVKLSYGAFDAQSLLGAKDASEIEKAIAEAKQSREKKASESSQWKQSQKEEEDRRQKEREAKDEERRADKEKSAQELQNKIDAANRLMEPDARKGNWDPARESQMRELQEKDPAEFRKHLTDASALAFVEDNYELTKNTYSSGGANWSARRKNSVVKDYDLPVADTKAKAIERLASAADKAIVATYSKRSIRLDTSNLAKGDKVRVGNKDGEIVHAPMWVEKSGKFRALVRFTEADGKAYEQFQDVENIERRQDKKSGDASSAPKKPANKLKQHGLKVTAVGDRWAVTGKTFVNREILKDLGGKYDDSGKEKTWWFSTDPTDAITNRLPDTGDGEQPGDGRDSDANVERRRIRSREAERPNERATGASAAESVSDGTKRLIQRGSKFGIPSEVLAGQVEDIGRVTKAFESGKPMFLVGSAPGMGKSFILGGSIAEIRNRIKETGGEPRFIYVTENQELISQLQRDLADYGLDDVEFVTYASIRGADSKTKKMKRPRAYGAVVLIDEAHNAKSLSSQSGQAISELVREADFAVYATATPFENVTEAKYLEASGIFDDVEAEVKKTTWNPKTKRNETYPATVQGFAAWAFAYGATLQWPSGAQRPVVYWHKHTTAEEDQIQANEWLSARGVYTQRPMILPPEMVTSELRAVSVSDDYVKMFNDVLAVYAEAEANAEDAAEAGQIRMHGVNVQKRMLEAAKVQEGIRRANELIEDGKQVIIFVNTKSERSIGRYANSEAYRTLHKISSQDPPLYQYPEIAEANYEWQQAFNMAKKAKADMRDWVKANPRPFAGMIERIAEAAYNSDMDITLPSVIDDLLNAFGDNAVDYTGSRKGLSDVQAKQNLDRWKSGKVPVIVATMAKGGTGLSYHDTTGKMPKRVQVNINLPWSGTDVEQVSGRLARLGTAKPVALEWVFADNIPFERELSKTVGSRMRSMQAAVQGTLGDMAQSIKDFEFGDAPSAPKVTPKDIRELDTKAGKTKEEGGDSLVIYDQLDEAKEKLAQQRLDAGEPYTIVVVACGDKKKSYRTSAQDLYDGDLFKKSREWAERNADDWVIASAKHGLIPPGTFIDPYNQRIGKSADEKRRYGNLFNIGGMVPKNLFEKRNGLPYYRPGAVKVVILGGKDYADAIRSELPSDVIVEDPLQGKQIGERLQWLNQQNGRAAKSPSRIQQLQDTFPLSREQATVADILFDVTALPGEIEIAEPGTPIPDDSLTQISKAAALMAKEGKKYATEEEFFAAWDKALKAVKGKRLGMKSTSQAVNDAAQDIDAWMKANPEFQDYYSKDNAKERESVSKLYPELLNDADWAFYKIVGAIASNSTTLSENITEQIDAWGNFRSKRKTIKDPSGIAEENDRRFSVQIGRNERGHPTLGKTGFPLHGGAQAVKAQHYIMLNEVINQQGSVEKAVQWLIETVPASEIRNLPKDIGAGPMNGKQARQIKDTVQAATGQAEQIPRMFVFGPKLGAYAMNHLGRSEYTTIDVWESRFWRSFFKDAPANTGLETDSAAREAFKKAGNEFAKKLGLSSSEAQAVRWYYMISQVNEAGYQRAKSNETISAYTERAVAKRLDSQGATPASTGQAAKPGAGRRSSSLRELLGGTIFGEEVGSNTLYQKSGLDPDAIPKAVLDKMSRRLRAMGYDSRGAEDVRRAIKERSLLEFNADWIAAYQFATGAEQSRKEKAAAKKSLPHVNWARLRELGVTTNPKEAGYIKPDGTFADLSGKREGGPSGARSLDHREAGGTAGMQEVIASGWVRMDENSGSIDIAKAPTAQQLSAITKMAERHNGELVVDLEDGLGEWSEGNEYYRTPQRRWSQQYPEGTKPKRIINDIKKFFDGNTPNSLYQKQRGLEGTVQAWTHFVSASKAIIGSTDKADVSSFFHELGHPMRRFLFNRDVSQEQRGNITDEDIDVIENFVGVKDGKWTVDSEERFVDALMSYWMEGKAPTAQLKTVFQKISQWLSSVLSVLARRVDLTPEVRAVFDKVHQRGSVDPNKLKALPKTSDVAAAAKAEADANIADVFGTKEQADSVIADVFGMNEQVPTAEQQQQFDAVGIVVKKTSKGWSVKGITDEQYSAIKDDFRGRRGNAEGSYLFRENPIEGLVGAAEELARENQLTAQAKEKGLVRTAIGDLEPEAADWYEYHRAERIKIYEEIVAEKYATIDRVLSEYMKDSDRGMFFIKVRRAAETSDYDSIVGFDEMARTANMTEEEFFELLLEKLDSDDKIAARVDAELAMELERAAEQLSEQISGDLADEPSEGIDLSFEFGDAAEEKQRGFAGMEDQLEDIETRDRYKRAKEARSNEPTTAGKQKALFDTSGDPDQMMMFDDGITPEDRVYRHDATGDVLFQSQVDPMREAALLAKSALEGGAKTFEQYVEHVLQSMPKAKALQNASQIEAVWEAVRRLAQYKHLPPAGKVSDLIAKNAKPNRVGPRVAGVRKAQAPFPDRQVEREPYTDHELTGIAKAVMNDLRELAGLSELEAAPPETIEQWAMEAQATMAADAGATTRLLNEITANPARALDHHDAMLLAFRYRELANQAEPHFQEMIDASKSGDAERIARARTNYILARQPMTEFEELTLKAKSTWGRTGVALQVLLRKDNTVAGLLRRAREANHGQALTPEQEMEMRDLANRFAELQKKLDEETARADKAEAEIASLRHLKKVVGESPFRKKPSRAQMDALDASLKKIAKLANVDLLFQRDETNPFHEAVQNYRNLGVETFAELRRRIQTRFGKEQAEKLEDRFKQAWEATKPETDVPAIVDKSDLGALTREAREIERSIVEGLLLDHSAEAVLEMRDEIVDMVHAEMQELVDESFTRRQTMDALSGYGQFSRPSQDATDSLLRNLNAEVLKLRQIDQLGDAIARTEQLRAEGMTDAEISDVLIDEGLLVKPTGFVRDTPTDTLRELGRRYSELKKEIPASSEGRAGLLQTAIAAIERGLTNRIRDLNRAIASQEEIKIGRKAPPTNEKIERLKQERDVLLKEYRKLFPQEKKLLTSEQRLANAIKAAERSIAIIEQQIKTRNFDVAQREELPDSPELAALKSRLKLLQAQRAAAKALELSAWENEGGSAAQILSKKKMSEAEKQGRRARKTIEQIKQKLKDLKDGRVTETSDRKDLLEADLRQQLNEWRSRLKAAKQAAKDAEQSQWESEGGAMAPDPKEAAVRKAYIASMQNRIAKLQQFLLEGDFAPKEKQAPRVMSKAELDLKKQLAKLNTEKMQKMAEYHLSHLKGVSWLADKVSEVLHLARAIETSMDLSALGRQGGLIALGHPSLAKNALIGVVKSMLQSLDKSAAFNADDFKWTELEKYLTGIDSLEAELAFMHKLTEGEWGEFRQLAGLDLPSTDQAITRQEEVFQGRWGKFVPGVGMSSRLYTMVLNKMRADMFDLMVEKLGRQGKPTLEEAKLIANFVNVMTGRSDAIVWKGRDITASLNLAFFAPRYVASRFQYLAMPFYLPFKGGLKANWQIKKAILKEYARTASGAALVLGLIALAGQLFWGDDDEDKPTVGLDPTKSDFLKPKFGETRLDFLAGLQQIFVLSARMAPELIGGGRIGDKKFSDNVGAPFEQNRLTVAARFARTKLAPGPGYVVTMLNGWENVVGQKADRLFWFPVHPAIGTTAQLFIPLSLQSVTDTFETQSIPVAAGASVLSALGVGMSTYGPKTEYITGTEAERQEQIKGDLKDMRWDSPMPAYAEFLTQEQLAEFEKVKNDRYGSKLYDATGSPESEAGIATKAKAMDAIKRSGVTYEEAKQRLLEYLSKPDSTGKKTAIRKNGVLTDAVRARLKTLKQIFTSE